MASDTIPHVVRQGEHIYGIAIRYGVSAGAIWDHTGNVDLRGDGRLPSILAPDDVVIVPRVPRKYMPLKVGGNNVFVASVPTVTVAFRLQDLEGKALPNERWESHDPEKTGASDGDGVVRMEKVPFSTQFLEFHLPDRKCILRVKVGYLDPVTTPRGRAQRLAHLGYLPSNAIRVSPETLAWAMDHFRAAEAPDASEGDDLDKALVTAHGGV